LVLERAYRKNQVLYVSSVFRYFHENTRCHVRNFSALIVEDQELVRQGLALILKQQFPDIRIHQAGSGDVAFKILETHLVNIVLLDIGIPIMNGAEIAEKILRDYPLIKVLIVTQYSGEAMIKNLLRAGIHSFFFKNSGGQEIKEAVSAVLSGKQYLPETIKSVLIPSTHIPAIAFSRREAQILLHLKMGRSSKEISKRLHLSEYTINSYREDMLRKTKTGNVAQLISYAYENGIIS
jgi:DNA-binding NarL/FixJ family response regulator